MQTELILSPLPHTWLIDLDGTILKHNGYKIDGHDTFLPGAIEFLTTLPHGDLVIFLTSRPASMACMTERFLSGSGIAFTKIIYDLPFGERILMNDSKPSGLKTAYSLNISRDSTMDVEYKINLEL